MVSSPRLWEGSFPVMYTPFPSSSASSSIQSYVFPSTYHCTAPVYQLEHRYCQRACNSMPILFKLLRPVHDNENEAMVAILPKGYLFLFRAPNHSFTFYSKEYSVSLSNWKHSCYFSTYQCRWIISIFFSRCPKGSTSHDPTLFFRKDLPLPKLFDAESPEDVTGEKLTPYL